jgi:hypothetical protein
VQPAWFAVAAVLRPVAVLPVALKQASSIAAALPTLRLRT